MRSVVDRIEEEIQPRISRVLESPFLRALSAGELTPDQLRAFALEYYTYTLAFPKCLAEVAANAPDDEARYPLIENLWEEYGAGDPSANHRTLFERFMRGLGLTEPEYVAGARFEATRRNVDELVAVCRNEPYLTGFGALSVGTEFFTVDEYSRILKGLRRYDFLDADSLTFWDVHTELDEFHYRDMRTVQDKWPDQETCYRLVRRGAFAAVDLEIKFWDGLRAAILD